MAKSLSRIVVSQMAGFLVFLIILAIANLLISKIDNKFFITGISFFNENIWQLLLLVLIGLINEIFWNLYIPFNLAAPILTAFYSVIFLDFMYKLYILLDKELNLGLNIPINTIYVLVVLIVVISGYLTIAARKGKPRDDFDNERRHMRQEKRKRRLEKEIKDIEKIVKRVDWEDVSDEFKEALYNLGRSINHLFLKKEKKKKK